MSNLEKIRLFAQAGGAVIFTSYLPEQATITNDNDHVKAIIKELTDNKKALFVDNPTPARLQTALSQQSRKPSLTFTSGITLRNVHKQLHGKNLWFFANPDASLKNVAIELEGEYRLEIWNPHTGETGKSLPVTPKDGKTAFSLTLDGCQSLFIVEK